MHCPAKNDCQLSLFITSFPTLPDNVDVTLCEGQILHGGVTCLKAADNVDVAGCEGVQIVSGHVPGFDGPDGAW